MTIIIFELMFITGIRFTKLNKTRQQNLLNNSSKVIKLISLSGICISTSIGYYIYDTFWNTSMEFIYHPKAITY